MNNCTTSDSRGQMFVLTPQFYQLLKTVGADGRFFSLNQVLDFMKEYISSRKLYDPNNPRNIDCTTDELGKVLGIQQFTIHEVIKLVLKHMFQVKIPHERQAPERIDLNKRKPHENSEASPSCCGESSKKARTDNGYTQNPSTMFLFVPTTPSYDSCTDSEISIQGYETSFVKDSSDDLWFLEDDHKIDVLEEDLFSVEYEVESVDSSNTTFSDTDSDIEDITHAAILVCKTDSDMEFWADSSSDEEFTEISEMSDGDKWKCSRCGSYNMPPMRFCQRCWEQRLGWLADRHERRPPIRNRYRKLLRSNSMPINSTDGNLDYQSQVSKLSDETEALSQASTSKETLSSQPSSQEIKDNFDFDSSQEFICNSSLSVTTTNTVCTVCLLRPKTATIVHGRTGHQVCCYPCARRLQDQRQKCPVCRRTIERVVRNFII